MKRIYLILFSIVCCIMVTNAQNAGGGATGSTSSSSSGGVSDGQAVRSALSQKRSGASEAQIATSLLRQGATPQQLQRLRGQYANQINKAGMSNAVDNGLRQALDRSRSNSEAVDNPTMQLVDADELLDDELVIDEQDDDPDA